VGEIAVASSEQALGINQLNKAVAEMDKVVQKNASSAEESASASEEMNSQAIRMKSFVSDLQSMITGRSPESGCSTAEKLNTAKHPKTPAENASTVLRTVARGNGDNGKRPIRSHDGKHLPPFHQTSPLDESDLDDF
jgi:methyl-accepting chemotaxis protein